MPKTIDNITGEIKTTKDYLLAHDLQNIMSMFGYDVNLTEAELLL